MSNPFATFRKNQSYWMAGSVLLAILAFVVAPAIEQMSSAFRAGDGSNLVFVRWNGGKMTVGDVQTNIQKHASLVRFLSALAQEVIDAGGQPRVPGFYIDPQSQQIMGLGIQTNSDEESICRTRILATEAKRLGVEFDEKAADEFILAFCDNRIPTQRLAEILRESTDGRLSSYDVRQQLKLELAAMIVRRTATTSFYANVPGETYQSFLKLNQTAKIEAFPVFVDDYLDKVDGQPSETEIRAIYDDGINLVANPNSPTPGFLRPYQANIEYVEANMQEWIDREKEKLSEEQLRSEYARRIALGQLQTPVTKGEDASQAEGLAEAPQEPAAEANPPQPANEETPANETPANETAADETAKETNNDSPTADTLQLSPPAADPSPEPATTPESADSPAEKPAAEASDEDQAAAPVAAVRLVAFQQDASNGDALPPAVVQPPQIDSPTSDEDAANQAGTAGDNPAATEPTMRDQTFEEARDEIANSLAREAAIPALDAAMTQLLTKEMKPYFGAYRQYAAFRDSEIQDSGEALQEPTKPDIKKLAAAAGLKYGQTGLIDGFKLSQIPVGQGNIRTDESGISGNVASVLMNPQLQLFRPLQSTYFDQSALREGRMPEFFQYLVWKVEERQAYQPELAEIRGEVVDAWKRQQARQLAESSAAALAQKVNVVAENPWQDALSTTEQSLVVDVDPFTWITRFGEFSMASNVPKLDAVGGEFMQKVFSSSPGQVTVAANESQNIYYVVRVINFSPEEAQLRERFAADPLKSGPLALAREDSDRLTQNWYEQLYMDLDVQWQMSPDQL